MLRREDTYSEDRPRAISALQLLFARRNLDMRRSQMEMLSVFWFPSE